MLHSYYMTYYSSNSGGAQETMLKHELVQNKDINYNWGSSTVGTSGSSDNVFIRFKGYITANINGKPNFL